MRFSMRLRVDVVAVAMWVAACGGLHSALGAQLAATVPTREMLIPSRRVTLGFLADGQPQPIVASVIPGSPAARAGLLVGDTISHVGDQPASLDLISRTSARLQIGDPITFTVRRAGRAHSVTLVVQETGSVVSAPVIQRDSMTSRTGAYLAAACREIRSQTAAGTDTTVVICPSLRATSANGGTGAPATSVPARTLRPFRRFADAWGARFEIASVAPTPAEPARLVVRSVTTGSIAERSGLRVGDVVIGGGGKPPSLDALIAARDEGLVYELRIERAGSVRRVVIGVSE